MFLSPNKIGYAAQRILFDNLASSWVDAFDLAAKMP
jgi:hypothetical protein